MTSIFMHVLLALLVDRLCKKMIDAGKTPDRIDLINTGTVVTYQSAGGAAGVLYSQATANGPL